MSTIDNKTDAMETALANALVVQILRTTNVLLRESRRLFRPHGLTEAQFNVLNVLADAPDGMTQRELGDILVVDRSNVTGLVDRMEAAGWVRRREMPGDRRAWRVQTTAKGRALWDVAHADYERAVLDAVRPMGVAKTRATLEGLAALEKGATGLATSGGDGG